MGEFVSCFSIGFVLGYILGIFTRNFIDKEIKK